MNCRANYKLFSDSEIYKMLNLVNPENSKTYNDDISFEQKTCFRQFLRLSLHFSKFRYEKPSCNQRLGFINQYVASFDGETILTDFDGVQKRLLATTSLTDPHSLARKHTGTLKLIDNWIANEKNSA